MPMVHPRMESPDSISPVFWISMSGVLPPAEIPDAAENARPSRFTPTRVSVGSAFISRNSQFVSLSGSQTTCVTPFFFISPRTISGLRLAFCVSLTMWSSRQACEPTFYRVNSICRTGRGCVAPRRRASSLPNNALARPPVNSSAPGNNFPLSALGSRLLVLDLTNVFSGMGLARIFALTEVHANRVPRTRGDSSHRSNVDETAPSENHDRTRRGGYRDQPCRRHRAGPELDNREGAAQFGSDVRCAPAGRVLRGAGHDRSRNGCGHRGQRRRFGVDPWNDYGRATDV